MTKLSIEDIKNLLAAIPYSYDDSAVKGYKFEEFIFRLFSFFNLQELVRAPQKEIYDIIANGKKIQVKYLEKKDKLSITVDPKRTQTRISYNLLFENCINFSNSFKKYFSEKLAQAKNQKIHLTFNISELPEETHNYLKETIDAFLEFFSRILDYFSQHLIIGLATENNLFIILSPQDYFRKKYEKILHFTNFQINYEIKKDKDAIEIFAENDDAILKIRNIFSLETGKRTGLYIALRNKYPDYEIFQSFDSTFHFSIKELIEESKTIDFDTFIEYIKTNYHYPAKLVLSIPKIYSKKELKELSLKTTADLLRQFKNII